MMSNTYLITWAHGLIVEFECTSDHFEVSNLMTRAPLKRVTRGCIEMLLLLTLWLLNHPSSQGRHAKWLACLWNEKAVLYPSNPYYLLQVCQYTSGMKCHHGPKALSWLILNCISTNSKMYVLSSRKRISELLFFSTV